MKGKDLALLERNIGKAVDAIEKSLNDGAKVGEVNNFYVESVGKHLAKIREELLKIEF
jgi:hypothetical protein